MDGRFDTTSGRVEFVSSLMKAHGPLVINPGNGLTFRRTDVAGALATLIDRDGDGLTDAAEAALGTNPLDSDSDDDGLSDGAEANTHGTDPLLLALERARWRSAGGAPPTSGPSSPLQAPRQRPGRPAKHSY